MTKRTKIIVIVISILVVGYFAVALFLNYKHSPKRWSAQCGRVDELGQCIDLLEENPNMSEGPEISI